MRQAVLKRPASRLVGTDFSATFGNSTVSIAKEISKRRTFAIISHPDAGKTTLTEKLLLYGGAIQEAGITALSLDDSVTDGLRKIYQERRDTLVPGLKKLGLEERKFIEVETPVVTIFGKTWLLHVKEVLRSTVVSKRQARNRWRISSSISSSELTVWAISSRTSSR